jgi:hypothetical protein
VVETQTWTYVLTGEVRSGAGAIISGINSRAGAICHADLFHPQEERRREAHEKYFGPAADPVRLPEWYMPGLISPYQYLSRTALVPQNEESSVGCYLSYNSVRQMELYDLFEEKCREGGFGIVHVVRNPVACFVSLKQAQQSGLWHVPRGRRSSQRTPMPLRLDADELHAFVQNHGTTTAKIRAACEDRLEIQYSEIVTDYQGVMRRVFDHIELPELPVLVKSEYLRLTNRPLPKRVSNWTELLCQVPKQVRELMEAEDLL